MGSDIYDGHMQVSGYTHPACLAGLIQNFDLHSTLPPCPKPDQGGLAVDDAGGSLALGLLPSPQYGFPSPTAGMQPLPKLC